MKRSAMKLLENWKHKKNRKPLLLQGARQVGKTYLINKFGKNYFDRIYTLNFEDPTVHTIFNNGPVDVESALLRMQVLLGEKINRKNDLIFFDEIQDCPVAINALKYFNENMPDLAIACAGSHIGISGSQGSFPVGRVNFETLHPLSFSEFLFQYKPLLAEVMQKAVSTLELDEFIHGQLWDAYLIYTLVGGMPEAVVSFLSEDDLYSALNSARDVHKTLIHGYINDFSKYCEKQMAHKISAVFQNIPSQLQAVHDQSTKRYQFSGVISGNSKYAQLQGPLDWLLASGLILRIPIASIPEQPLSAYCKPNMFKLLMFDIGILNSQLNIDFGMTIDQTQGSYKGFIAENFVAQQIRNTFDNQMYSWAKARSEIEFVLPYRDSVIPVEVKSGIRTKSKSLTEYKKRYAPLLAVKLSGKNIRHERGHLNAPIYLAEFLPELIAQAVK